MTNGNGNTARPAGKASKKRAAKRRRRAGGFKPSDNVKPKAGEKAQEEVSAGGIVYKRTPDGVRVAFILDPYGKWSFAKGHVEDGETIEQAAVRETMEEMGIDEVRVIMPLGEIDLWFRDRYRAESRGKLIHKKVHYFLMEAPSDARGKPEKEEKIKRIIWVPVRNMLRRSSYDDVKFLLRKAKKHLAPLVAGEKPPRRGKHAHRKNGGDSRGADRRTDGKTSASPRRGRRRGASSARRGSRKPGSSAKGDKNGNGPKTA